MSRRFEVYEKFKGRTFHTGRWPKEPIDWQGKRVGVIGTAATGIQVIQTIAPLVERLTVCQRTRNYIIPMRNPKIQRRRSYGVAHKVSGALT